MLRKGVEGGMPICAISVTHCSMAVGSSLQELRMCKSLLSEHEQGINQGYKGLTVKHNLSRHRLEQIHLI